MTRPTLLWLRRDLRLADHPALHAALDRGGPVAPVYILDPVVERWGAALRWRLGESLADLAPRLAAKGAPLTLRRGEAAAALRALAEETGAGACVFSTLYDAASRERDEAAARALAEAGVACVRVPSGLLREPWEVETKAGGPYKVYTPYWRAVREREVGEPAPEPAAIPFLDRPPRSERLEDWRLGADMRRGGPVVARYAVIGEARARARLDRFLGEKIAGYAEGRQRMDLDAGSSLSENLTLGEISPRTVWTEARRALRAGAAGAETFLKEIAWREFAHHLLWRAPRIEQDNWNPSFDAFPWREDNAEAERWRRGMTGEPIIDAAMRQLYATGRMHNRARMVVGSYLTKHLLTHWRVGERWFRDCLTDWDPANNALGWQWVAGSGPDASPFFRVFSPASQAEKFDPDGAYRRRWVAELARPPGEDALAFFEAAPRSWGLDPLQPYPHPLVDLKAGRERALSAYRGLRRAG